MRRGRVLAGFFERPLCAERDGRSVKEGYLQPYSGLRSVAARIDRDRFDVSWGYPSQAEGYDFLLLSMISFYDAFNLMREIPETRGYRVVVGGPACHNILSYLSRIDIAVFGRCDGDDINRVLGGEDIPNAWRRESDPDFSHRYTVGRARLDDPAGQLALLPGIATGTEKMVGCPMRCRFCFYSHWNHWVRRDGGGGGYFSGYAPHEDYFTSLSWDRCRRGGVTGLDGVNEETRFRVGKRISRAAVLAKLLSLDESEYEGLHRAKVYLIYGYPWETPGLGLDLLEAVREADAVVSRRLLIRLQCSHFIPFPKTPMECDPVNPRNFARDPGQWRYDGRRIRLSPGHTNQSPRLAALSAWINRYDGTHPDRLEQFYSARFWRAEWGDVIEVYREWGLFEPLTEHPLANVEAGGTA